jgi:hypothetical protein
MVRNVHARRCILTAFLQSLGLPQSVIRRDVHGLEHHLSEETLEQLRLVEYVDVLVRRGGFEGLLSVVCRQQSTENPDLNASNPWASVIAARSVT